jgi:hypothetical protein
MTSTWPIGLEISAVPLRKVIRRSSAISNGTFRTYKHPDFEVTHIAGESPNELLLLPFLEVDPNVKTILSQPTVLHPELDGASFTNTPDYAVHMGHAAAMVEVKGARQYARLEIKLRLLACARYVEAAGYDYVVTTGADLRGSAIRHAVDDLWTFHRRTYTALQLDSTLAMLRYCDMRVGDVVALLERALPGHQHVFTHVLSMAAGCRIFIDLDPKAEVGPDSIVRFPDPRAMPPILFPFRRPADDLEVAA